jgi:hypothetical protein
MNELKEELDIIFDLTQTAYIKDGKIVPFVAPISYEKELKRKIMQLIEIYTAKARAEELKLLLEAEIIKPEYHNAVVGKFTQLTNNKEGIENE